MAELPTEQNGESTETQKALLTPFLIKTYQLVDDSEVDDMISWNEDGTGFIIRKPAEFSRDLLPKYFKHNNLSSFVRQLNTYGFRKVVPDRWEFANDFFKRGEKGLLHDIQRRKMSQLGSVPSTAPTPAATAEGPSTVPVTDSSPPLKSGEREEPMFLSQGQGTNSAGLEEKGGTNEGSSSSKSKSTYPELRKENRRLEEENQQMTDELSHLKGLCGDIFSMMANYGPSSGQQDHGNVSMESRQLELLQSGNCLDEQGGSSGGNAGAMDDKEEAKKEEDNNNNNHMLFGVSIGAKRRKLNNEDESSDKQQQQHDGTESYSYSNTAHSEKKKETGL